MTQFVMFRCDICGKELPLSNRVVTTYWPRTARDGRSLSPLVQHYCDRRCSQVAHQQRHDEATPHRPWCCGVELGVDGCDCLLVDDPRDSREMEDVW